MMRPKILYLSHKPECGGAEKSLLDLLGAVDRERFEPHLATSGPGTLAAGAADLGVPVHLFPMDFSGPLHRLVGLLGAARRLSALHRSHRFDLLHANTLHAGYCAVLARTGVPLVWHLRDLDYPALGRRAAGRADLLIANSRATAAMFPSPWLDSGRVRVIHNGVGPEFFASPSPTGALHRELGLTPKTPLVGVVGRLSPWKGQEDLLRAAALVETPAHFLVVGGQPFIGNRGDRGYPERLAAMAARPELAGRVHLLGHRGDTAALMAELTLLVHPSREPEPFGRDLAEAQARGVPVIGTAAGGVLEIIADGSTGLLVPPRDPAALARAIESLLADPDRARELGGRGRHAARERFTAAVHAREVEQAYASLPLPTPALGVAP